MDRPSFKNGSTEKMGKACAMVNAVCGITQGFALWAVNREEIQHDNHGKHFVFKKSLQL